MVWATNHFRPYLFGNTFTLVSDHEPLKWLMTTQKLIGKMAKWSLLLQEYDFIVQHRLGTENANAECLNRYPLASEAGAPIPDYSRGEVLPVASYLACMAGVGIPLPRKEEAKEIWEDVEMLRILQTHHCGCGIGAKERDKVYRRARGYCWMGDNLFMLLEGGAMVVVPQPKERMQLALDTHRRMGHFGVQRVLDLLQKNYYWRGMGNTVVADIQARLLCAQVEASFRESGKEL